MIVFFFKQKTAYEMRISDWSSDVCSSDLDRNGVGQRALVALLRIQRMDVAGGESIDQAQRGIPGHAHLRAIAAGKLRAVVAQSEREAHWPLVLRRHHDQTRRALLLARLTTERKSEL